MLLEEKAEYYASAMSADSDAAARYLAADRDHDTNRELLESGDYFQSAEVSPTLYLV